MQPSWYQHSSPYSSPCSLLLPPAAYSPYSPCLPYSSSTTADLPLDLSMSSRSRSQTPKKPSYSPEAVVPQIKTPEVNQPQTPGSHILVNPWPGYPMMPAFMPGMFPGGMFSVDSAGRPGMLLPVHPSSQGSSAYPGIQGSSGYPSIPWNNHAAFGHMQQMWRQQSLS